MRKIRKILRHKGQLGLTHRETALRVGVSIGSVTKVMRRARATQLSWETASTLDEDELAGILEGPREKPEKEREKPDPIWIHTERKRAGVTLEILYLEYLQDHPSGYRYTQFCEIYRSWLKNKKLSMRQNHVAGEKLFIDYSGKKPRILDVETGAFTEVELFVATMG
ncbi:MAG: transposase, partial [Planctomycetaceae bacterium]|nr:transposase [Planctomycetaceae bacterium]